MDGGGRKVRAQPTYLDNLLPILDFLFLGLLQQDPRAMAVFFLQFFFFLLESLMDDAPGGS